MPPGLAPITFGKRAEEAIAKRKQKVQSWYLDMTLVRDYWNEKRIYHHTGPINMTYAMHEGLRLIKEEGLMQRAERLLLTFVACMADGPVTTAAGWPPKPVWRSNTSSPKRISHT